MYEWLSKVWYTLKRSWLMRIATIVLLWSGFNMITWTDPIRPGYAFTYIFIMSIMVCYFCMNPEEK